MTLVIGKVLDGNVIILGDTALTIENRKFNPIIQGCHKQYIVAPKIAIVFAGNVDHIRLLLLVKEY